MLEIIKKVAIHIRCAAVNFIGKSAFYLFRIFPIKKNKIIFNSFYGKGYSGNSKSICDALIRSAKDYDLVFEVSNVSHKMPEGVRVVRSKSLKWLYEMCTARVWIDNCRKAQYVRKRKGQYYIQTWHGDIGLKKAEKSAIKTLSKSYVKDAINDSKMADLFVSGNKWFCDLVRTDYWYVGEIATCGYPRRDMLYSNDEKLKTDIKNTLGVNKESKILFYAPTFRNNQSDQDLSVYQVDWENVLNAMKDTFGGDWVGMVRLHPNISKLSNELNIPDNVINATKYPDMQELLFVSDCCISDYSSSLLEFAVTGKPGFIFAKDVEKYRKERDYCFQFEQLPFSLSQTNDELIENINRFDGALYSEDHKRFYGETIGLFPEGHASDYIADRINLVCFGSKTDII